MVITYYNKRSIKRVRRLSILPLVISKTEKNNISLSSFVPENLVSRDGFGSPVPRQLAHSPYSSGRICVLMGFLPSSAGGVQLLCNRHTPSGQSRVYRVTQLRTDGVHCRESAGTGPVNLELKKSLNASRPSVNSISRSGGEMSKRSVGIIGCNTKVAAGLFQL